MHPLAVTSLLLAPAAAQSIAWGDLSTKDSPYGIPAKIFAQVTSSPRSANTFAANGYNTSISAGPTIATGYDTRLEGWDLHFNVTADVSRAESDDDTIVKSQFFEATTLAISSPASLSGPGFNSEQRAANASSDGECLDLVIPISCEGHFVDGVGSAYELTDPSDVDNGIQGRSVPILAAGSAPYAEWGN
ncbi:hypothetical protein B0H67DRAFT_641114 [Lasiosphaeris hirsuta]|uniref:Uncharacterized protein n=1 Tax=Lasiosphaeris hirsuta TaxID=260670 RepID=A0AA40AZ20_9PEZI|nr:hypothetical protein B0H67DRAFT_641114 [Lasiosphaeris hirsuta]